jgi:hypothetical protein
VPLTGGVQILGGGSGVSALSVTQVPSGGSGTGSYSTSSSGGGDLVIHMNGVEVARIFGPDLRSWLASDPGRNAVAGTLTRT